MYITPAHCTFLPFTFFLLFQFEKILHFGTALLFSFKPCKVIKLGISFGSSFGILNICPVLLQFIALMIHFNLFTQMLLLADVVKIRIKCSFQIMQIPFNTTKLISVGVIEQTVIFFSILIQKFKQLFLPFKESIFPRKRINFFLRISDNRFQIINGMNMIIVYVTQQFH